jgi:hypothetical protein
MRLQRLGEAASQAASGLINQTNAFTLQRVNSRQKPKSAQSSVRTCRKIEARWIGTVDDIEVMIAWQNQNPLSKPRKGRQGVEQF